MKSEPKSHKPSSFTFPRNPNRPHADQGCWAPDWTPSEHTADLASRAHTQGPHTMTGRLLLDSENCEAPQGASASDVTQPLDTLQGRGALGSKSSRATGEPPVGKRCTLGTASTSFGAQSGTTSKGRCEPPPGAPWATKLENENVLRGKERNVGQQPVPAFPWQGKIRQKGGADRQLTAGVTASGRRRPSRAG